jgi:hypothetical protein
VSAGKADWVEVDGYVLADRALEFASNGKPDALARTRARIAGGGIPELGYVRACSEAGVQIKWGSERRLQDGCIERGPWIPTWAAVILVTFSMYLQVKRAELKKASRDPNRQEAILATFRLGGLKAVRDVLTSSNKG